MDGKSEREQPGTKSPKVGREGTWGEDTNYSTVLLKKKKKSEQDL